MDTKRIRTRGAATVQSPVFYRTAVQEFLRGRVPERIDVDLLADEILRDVCDQDVLSLFGGTPSSFRETLLAVVLLRLRLFHPGESLVPDRLWPVPPATESERSDFDRLYAASLVAGAEEEILRRVEGHSPRLALLLRLRYGEGLPVARVAERTGIATEAVARILAGVQKTLRRVLLDVLRLVCATEEEAAMELRYLVLLLAGRPVSRSSKGGGEMESNPGRLAQEARSWLQEVVRELREVHGRYAIAGGSAGETDRYVRAKQLALTELCRRLDVASEAGLPALIALFSEYEPESWLGEEYGDETYRLVCGKVNLVRGALLARIHSGAALPEPTSVA